MLFLKQKITLLNDKTEPLPHGKKGMRFYCKRGVADGVVCYGAINCGRYQPSKNKTMLADLAKQNGTNVPGHFFG